MKKVPQKYHLLLSMFFKRLTSLYKEKYFASYIKLFIPTPCDV
jgi:hypothetical protein